MSDWLYYSLIAQYTFLAALEAVDRQGWRCVYWLAAGLITLSVLNMEAR